MGKKGATPKGEDLRPKIEDALKWAGCTASLGLAVWNMGQIEGTYYTRGHYKVPQHLTDIPRLSDPDDPRYRFHGNPALGFITEGNKHFSAGCEAYGFENGGNVEKCLLARGFICQYHQPQREVINEKGMEQIITCPPRFSNRLLQITMRKRDWTPIGPAK